MRINIRNFETIIRKPFLLIDYIVWLLLDISKFNKIHSDEISNVLIIHTGAIGEVLLITPLLKAIKLKYNCKITCMVSEGKEDILMNNPYINEVILDKGTLGIKQKIIKLKEKKFDLAIIYQASFKNSYICWRAGIKYRIGGFSRIKRFPTLFYTRRLYPLWNLHALDYSLKILKLLNIREDKKPPEIFINKEEEEKIQRKFKLRGKKYIVIHPGFGPANGSSGPPRFWSYERYGKIINFLLHDLNYKIVLTGTKDQNEMINKIISNAGNSKKILNLSGKTNIRELISIIKCSTLVLAPDTGSSHIAASLGVPLVNMMDASPKNWAPIGKNSKIINLYIPREVYLFEKGKLFGVEGGVKDISYSEVENSINKMINPKYLKKHGKKI